VYYASTTGEDRNISRTPSAGGAPQQVTKTGEFALEEKSGRYLVYSADEGNGHWPVLLLPSGGGAARQLVACAMGFALGADALYYVACELESGSPSIHRLDLLSSRDRKLGVLPGYMRGISVSPDGSSILYQKGVFGTGADIMLVENFR